MDDGPLGNDKSVVYRHIDHSIRGWLAEKLYERADEIGRDQTEELRDLLVEFGELDDEGKCLARFDPSAGENGLENGRSRIGYSVLPGVKAGIIEKALSFEDLLQSKFWENTRFYQPQDFLWQPTMFEPVGGMDHVQRAFADQVKELGGRILLNSPVTKIDYDENEFIITVAPTTEEEEQGVGPKIFRADYVFSNMAIPFWRRFYLKNYKGYSIRNSKKDSMPSTKLKTKKVTPTNGGSWRRRRKLAGKRTENYGKVLKTSLRANAASFRSTAGSRGRSTISSRSGIRRLDSTTKRAS